MGNAVSHCEEAVQEIIVEEEEIIEEPPKVEITIETAPHDPRFATINQARYCFVAYNEAHKCFKEKSEEDSECRKLAKKYRSICPMEWLEAWNEARENGTWMGKY